MAQAGRINHPTADPSLPSFVHPALADVLPDLELVRDCWDLLRDAKKKYLPKEVREPQRAYEGRVMRSNYPSFYRDGVIGFAGALSRWSLRSAPASFEAAQNNVDGEGTSLKAFLMQADSLVRRLCRRASVTTFGGNSARRAMNLPSSYPEGTCMPKAVSSRTFSATQLSTRNSRASPLRAELAFATHRSTIRSELNA